MTMELFNDIIAQTLDMGFYRVWLTPMLGDVFADPCALEKFDRLEQAGRLRQFGFFTNFILPRTKTIETLAKYRKLSTICISVYGHDSESFQLVTQKPKAQYDRLVRNLTLLARLAPEAIWQENLSFSFRTVGGVTLDTLPENELTRPILALREQIGTEVEVAEQYDSWGGTITDADIAPIGRQLTDGRWIYKYGVCRKALSSVQIRADGRVHACACRDVDGSLIIGDLGNDKLETILSLDNPRYRQIIESQNKGQFNANCTSCAAYDSIYDERAIAYERDRASMPLEQALARIGGG